MESRLIENKIHHFLIKNNLTLSLAESCTGGGLCSRFVQMPGCSIYFLGAIVCYSRSSKEKLLGVSPITISSFGEVSAFTVEEMADGALKTFDSDIAVAISGIAGPADGKEEKPVGTIFISIASKLKSVICLKYNFEGNRTEIIAQSINTALYDLWKYVNS